MVRQDGVLVSGRAVQRHRLALLALLALAPGGVASRDRLLGHLWPESELERARQLLNQAVYQLRKALGEAAILSSGDELRLNPDVVGADVASFEDALAHNDPARAVALYQGPFLGGFFLSGASEFEHWVDRERARLAGAYGQALETLAEGAEAEHNYPVALRWWKTRVAQDPYDSRLALRLMQALEAGGNRAGALQHAAVHAHLLQEEFGIAAPAELEKFADQLRRSPAEIATESDGTPPGRRLEAVHVAASEPAVAPPPTPAVRRKPRLGYAITAAVAAVSGAAFFSFAGRDSDARWLEEAIPRIEAYLDVADWESAYAVAREAETRVPNSPELAELWPRISWRVTIPSEPAGARVFRQAYSAPEDQWEELGPTPLIDIRIPYGLSRLRFEMDGHRPLLRAIGGGHINWQELRGIDPDNLLVGPETYRLDTPEALPPEMVHVPGGTIVAEGDSVPVRDFFLGRHEVTNADFKRFVDAGAYHQPDFWPPIVLKGDTVAWRDAVALWVDRTGRAGPSTWEAGDFPPGESDFPVTGVSWYEASAYARFAGRELPTAHHWHHALANAMFPWLLPASNFSGDRPRRVTDGRAMSHVGAFDLTGNVREWTSTAIGAERIILGGSWNDPYYVAGTTDTSAPPEDRSAGNGIRLALTFDVPAEALRIRAPMAIRTTTSPAVQHAPVSDDVYAAYSRVFDYDRGPLNDAVLAVDTTRVWIRDRIQVDAGYGTEQLLLHMYLPTTGRPPYQTVVYWPGWDTFFLDDVDVYFAKQIDFIVKSGRAVAFPIYRGTFERRMGNARTRPGFGTAEYRDNTIYTVKDMRRTIDYLETRPDIDAGALAFFGYSWGGVNGPVAMAQEPRFRVGIIQIGLLPPMTVTPEVDPVNSLPRVRVPTLMFSGEFDPMVPSENSDRYFALIGTQADKKRHVIAIGGHFVPRQLLIRETLDWLDRYLGTVRVGLPEPQR